MAMNVFELFAKLGLDTSEYESGLESALGAGTKFTKAVGTAVLGASTAVVGFGTKSVQAGMSFDSAMSQVAATMGTTVDQIGDLRDFAQEMGSTTSFSATQAAEALNYMALAGYDAETSMSMLPTVLNLAAAGGIQLGEASDMVTDASSALGLTIEETSIMVDQMAAASSASNTSVAQLGQAFLTVGATARNMSGGTNELATILGVLADNGIKGAEGGTHLRNIILSLQNAANEDGIISFNNGLEDVNVSLYDADGNMRSLVDVITEMQGGMEGMTQASQDAIISGMFNKADLASVNALLGTNAERYDELSEKIAGADGAAEAMADTQLDNLAGDITLFKSALEGAEIALSDQLTPTLREFVQLGSDGLSDVTTAFQEGGLEGAFGALGTWLSDAVNMIVEYIPDIIDAGIELLEAFGGGIIDNADTILNAVTSVVGILAEKLLDPDKIQSVILAGADILLALVNGIAEHVEEVVPAIVSVISTIVSTMMSPQVRVPLLRGGIQIITGLIGGLAEATPELIAMIPEIIADTIVTLEELAPDIGEAALSLLNSLGEMILGAIIGLMGSSWEEIGVGYEDIMAETGEFFANLIPSIGEGVAEIIECLGEALADIIENIVNTFSDIFGEVGDFFRELPQDIAEGFADIVAQNVEFWGGLLSDAGEGLDNIISSVASFGSDLWQSFVDTFDNVKDTVSGAIDDLLGFMDFDWSLPELKLPHFSVSGGEAPWGFGGQGSLPKVSISWYKKAMNTPYLLDSATIFGAANGQYLGGGEAGTEMIYSHSKLMADIGAAIDSRLSNLQFTVPVYIGGRKIDQQIVMANARNTVVSGGR